MKVYIVYFSYKDDEESQATMDKIFATREAADKYAAEQNKEFPVFDNWVEEEEVIE